MIEFIAAEQYTERRSTNRILIADLTPLPEKGTINVCYHAAEPEVEGKEMEMSIHVDRGCP